MLLRPKGTVCALCNRGDCSMHNCASCETPIRYNESAQVQAIHRDGVFFARQPPQCLHAEKSQFFSILPMQVGDKQI